MSKIISHDMTAGSEAEHIVRFALPMIAGNILQQVYNLADTAVVGKFIGDDALAAVGATGSITYFFCTLCIGLAIGAGVIIAQFFGAGQKDKVRAAIFNSAVITLIFGVVVSAVSVAFTRPVLRLLGTPAKLIDTSVVYMRIACSGTIAVAAYNWINSVMRSLGDSKTPLIFLAVASLTNVALDLLFVVGFKTGVGGAALATVISQGLSAGLCIIYGFSKNKDMSLTRADMKPDKIMMKKCVFTGVPIALQNAFVSLSMITLQKVTNTFGSTVMTAYTVSMKIEQLAQQPFNSLGAALSAFAGQNIGAGKDERAVRGYKFSMKLEAGFALAVCILFIIFGKPLAGCFANGKEVIKLAAFALCLTSCFYIPLGAIHVTRGFLNGAGDTGYALFNGAVEVVCRITFSLILTKIAFIGYYGIWLTTCITWLATALFSIIRYKQGKWRTKSKALLGQ